MKTVLEYFASSFVVRCTCEAADLHDEPVAIFRTESAAQSFIENAAKDFKLQSTFRVTPLQIVH